MPVQAIKTAVYNEQSGVKRYSLVTSGRTVSYKNIDRLCLTYKAIQKHSNIKLCASMGLLNREKLERLKSVGVSHYHCNLESSRRFFPTVCSTHTYEEKIETIKIAQSLGLSVCSGGIIGMGNIGQTRYFEHICHFSVYQSQSQYQVGRWKRCHEIISKRGIEYRR